ncbi:MAG: hypothetical protein HS104_21135 [Polyangiaceae bacterium]|nr:hypothetical protein [Polyangiaceae bacterium]MCE7889656.1 hypothetical protein [Sorangiineae bacterium PRO1]MCL4749711.1 hypothetical protein [Myxococcales bacterium]
MCIFSQPVSHVAATKIFARVEGGEQLLAYEMELAALGDVAMVLPLPVEPGHGEAGLRFIDLSGYPGFFDDLRSAFPEPISGQAFGASRAVQHLVVHQVGDFEASFVPSLADFGRLEPRFVVAPEIWQRLPQYRDFGFAVFKLRGEKQGFWQSLGFGRRRAAETKKVHPMALAFRTRAPAELFFPTVHVHSGRVEERAAFDHELYCQARRAPAGWFSASKPVGSHEAGKSQGLLSASAGCFRLVKTGLHENADVIVKPPPRGVATRAEHPEALELVVSQPVVGGALTSFDNVVRNVLGRLNEELRALHQRHVAGWIGSSTVLFDFDAAGGQPLRVDVESDYDDRAFVAELEQLARTVVLPPLPGSGVGSVELRVGLGFVPRSPVPGAT